MTDVVDSLLVFTSYAGWAMLLASGAFTVSMGLMLFAKRGNQDGVITLIILGASGCIAGAGLIGIGGFRG